MDFVNSHPANYSLHRSARLRAFGRTYEMSVNRFRNLILIPWLSLPIILASYLLFWNRMPSELAVQFTSSGKPVTLMSRGQSLLFDLIISLIVLSICSWKLWSRDQNPQAILGYYFAIAAMTIISLGIVIYNVAT